MWRIRDSEQGASVTEYAAVIILVGAITAAVFTSGMANAVRDLFINALCRIEAVAGGVDCDDVSTTEVSAPNPDNPGGIVDGSGSQSGDQARFVEPSEEDYEAAADDLADIRDYYENPDEHQAEWLDPTTWLGNVDPARTLSRMPQNELDALLWSLDDDELATLMDDDELREIIMSEASLDTLRRIREIDPSLIEANTEGTAYRKPEWNEEIELYEDTYYGDDAYFAPTTGSLWGDDGEATLDDINQGNIGDCWWLAAAGALLHTDPGAIEDMIEENDNGTFTVTFPDTNEEITVTPDLASYGGVLYANPGDDNALWPAILEKAYAEREGGYDVLDRGYPEVGIEALSGEETSIKANYELDELQDWYDDGEPIVVSTLQSSGPLYRNGELISYHAYVLTNIEDGMVELYNPYGMDHPDPIPIEDFYEQTYGVYVAD